MAHSTETFIGPLDVVVRRLLLGDWKAATVQLSGGLDLGDHPELVGIASCLAGVARNQALQSVRGDVRAAMGQLDAASRRLRADGPVPRGTEPPRHLPITHLRWEADRLVQRDVADLEALRRIAETLPRGRPEIYYAAVEHLTMIEFDPFTVQVHPRDHALTGLDAKSYARWRTGNRLDMSRRASLLRQFADVRRGSVTDKTWQRMGGYPRVREQALRILADEPVTRGRVDLPLRLGRRRAWEYACGWTEDTTP